jgi:hypothetical protein
MMISMFSYSGNSSVITRSYLIAVASTYFYFFETKYNPPHSTSARLEELRGQLVAGGKWSV